MDTEEYYPTTIGPLRPCDICGRTFNPESLEKHEVICQKNAAKKRKTFDSSKQRSIPDAPAIKKTGNTRTAKNQNVPTTSKAKWRQKHQEFIQTIRSAKEVTQAIKEGKPLPPPPPPTINPDYVQCPHCLRRFSENAATRHIDFCAEQHKRLETKNKLKTAETMKAAAKQDRRNTYKPPMPSSGIRRQYDNGIVENKYNFASSASKVRPRRQDQAVKPRSQTMSQVNGRQNSDVISRRKNNNSTFDTSMPASSSVRTRTGLKATVLTSNSASDIESADQPYESSDRVKQNMQGRKNYNSETPENRGYYKPSSKTRNNRFGEEASYSSSKMDWDFDFNDTSSPARKQTTTRKTTGARSRVHTDSQSANTGQNHRHDMFSKNSGQYEQHDSLNDFVAREFGARRENLNKNNNGIRKPLDSHQTDLEFRSKYSGQGEPAHVSFVSDSSQEGYKGSNPTSRFCHECGSRFPVSNAKFCCECGMKRIRL